MHFLENQLVLPSFLFLRKIAHLWLSAMKSTIESSYNDVGYLMLLNQHKLC